MVMTWCSRYKTCAAAFWIFSARPSVDHIFCVRFFSYSFYPILLKLYRNSSYYMKCSCNFHLDLSNITGVIALWIFFAYRIYAEQICVRWGGGYSLALLTVLVCPKHDLLTELMWCSIFILEPNQEPIFLIH